jgi:hypothetical protein
VMTSSFFAAGSAYLRRLAFDLSLHIVARDRADCVACGAGSAKD